MQPRPSTLRCTPALLKPCLPLTHSLPRISAWTRTHETQWEVGGGHFLRNVLGKGSQAHKTADAEFRGYVRRADGRSVARGWPWQRALTANGHEKTFRA